MVEVNLFSLGPESGNLNPLPRAHRQGIAGVAVLAGLSFVSSTVVLLYLTVKLARWHIKTWRENRRLAEEPTTPVDLSLGLAEHHFTGGGAKPQESRVRKEKRHPNQFLVLIYNLLLADIHQSTAFLFNLVWVARNGIEVQTTTCWVQGWFVSTGDLSSSLFITAIGVHTYLAVVWKYTPPQWAVYATVLFLWAFNYFLAALGVWITQNGRDAGGFYVRAAGWCWINIKYDLLRLLLHYLWIFISFALTSILYALITISLRKYPSNPPTYRQPSLHLPTTSGSSTRNTHPEISPGPPTLLPTNPLTTPTNTNNPQTDKSNGSSHHHKAFLLYPVIYILCTAPLALGRIATMAGVSVPISYFCTAGALITSNGWLDVLLWCVTRHQILFGADVDSQEAGVDTFTFMRTPRGRRYGNLVWVEGNSNTGVDGGEGGGEGGREWRRRSGAFGWVKRRMGWRPLGFGAGMGSGGGGDQSLGLAGGMEKGGAGRGGGLAIQMDMVTTVVVETTDAAGRGRGRSWERRRSCSRAHARGGARLGGYDASSGYTVHLDGPLKEMG